MVLVVFSVVLRMKTKLKEANLVAECNRISERIYIYMVVYIESGVKMQRELNVMFVDEASI